MIPLTFKIWRDCGIECFMYFILTLTKSIQKDYDYFELGNVGMHLNYGNIPNINGRLWIKKKD
jgi:hypothetical protein